MEGEELFVGKKVTVIGWGERKQTIHPEFIEERKKRRKRDALEGRLHEAEVKVMSNKKCQKMINKVVPDKKIGSNILCAYKPGVRGERLLQTHTLIGQEVQLPRSDWTRVNKLYLLSNQSLRL